MKDEEIEFDDLTTQDMANMTLDVEAIKKELLEKLEEFATYSDSLEEVFENKEQIEVSKFYEKLPKPHALAMQEWLDGKIYYRNTKDSEAEA